MKVLVIGSGGREHAIVWKLKQSSKIKKLYCAPGNAGISEIAECINIKSEDTNALLKFAQSENIDLTVVGPEIPLSLGIVNQFEKAGLKIFGPTREAALIESSKSFAKEFMRKFQIPTATYEIFYDKEDAINYVNKRGVPIVIKADGLAAGKGVIVAKTVEDANKAIEDILGAKIFGAAGNKIVIEEHLEGEEPTFLAFVDGTTPVPMVSSKDHKRVFDNDEGPNTGGMGAYSPVLKKDIENAIIKQILLPTVSGLSYLGKKYKGVLYIGLMITKSGPKVIEYNCRFGDPETQVVLPRLKSDLLEVILATIDEKLSKETLEWDKRNSVCVVLASGGYPGKYENGKEIAGLKEVNKLIDIIVFHAGTSKVNGKIVTNGGRVLGVTSLGDNIQETIEKVYFAVNKIRFENMHFRKDIAKRALK